MTSTPKRKRAVRKPEDIEDPFNYIRATTNPVNFFIRAYWGTPSDARRIIQWLQQWLAWREHGGKKKK